MPALLAAAATRTPLIVRIGGDMVWESYVERTKEPVRFSEFYEAKRRLSLKERLMRAGTRMLVRDARKLLFNTRFQRDIWQKAYGFDASEAGVVENFVPQKEEAAPPAQGKKIFVATGRDIALKNRAKLELAFAKIREKNPDAELDVRSLPPAEHRARLRECYAIVIASISDIGPNTAIDAVVAGKPFITTEDTGAKERLADLGLFIDTRSDAALVQALETMLVPEQYERFAARIRAFAFTHSWDEMADEILSAYAA